MSNISDLKELQSVIIARQLATYVPSSLSIDDLKLGKESKKPLKNSIVENQNAYIPPSPSVSSIGSNSNKEQEKKPEAVSKFAFLLGNKTPKPKKSISMLKMKYELPNVQKIGSVAKNLKPILAISFSNLDFKNEKNNQIEIKTPDFLPEAIQISSDISDSDEE